MRLISKQAFREYLSFRRFSNEQLADETTRILRERGYDFRCSESTVAFLRSKGKASRWSCRPETASAIEAALNAPSGSIFAAEVIVASPTDNRRSA